MASINAYLTFDGNCAEAMSFYRDCLGAELTLMKVGDSPAASQLPKETHDMIMHAALTKGSLSLMASDLMGHDEFRPGNTVSLMLQCSSEEEIRSTFSKLKVGGKVTTDLKVEFWGAMYGDVTDKFGLRWMFNWEKPAEKS